MKHKAEREADVMLRLTRDVHTEYGLVSVKDRIVIDLNDADVDVLGRPDVDTAPHRHSEFRGVDLELVFIDQFGQ